MATTLAAAGLKDTEQIEAELKARAKSLRDTSNAILVAILILVFGSLSIFVSAGSIAAAEQNSVYSKAASIEARLSGNERKLDELVKKLADSKTDTIAIALNVSEIRGYLKQMSDDTKTLVS